ncbi:MAG TPA: hypothetical protein VKA49_14435 [Flavitalea sp.]|nr:hypothetical protein [Flavitalea sp.]
MQSQKLRFSCSWEEVREKLKETNINLTDEDLDYQPGREDELLERLQQKINKPKEEIRELIESVAVNSGKAG